MPGLFWVLVRKNSELVNFWRLGKQIAGLGRFHQRAFPMDHVPAKLTMSSSGN
jgi:hypothetical protein